MFVHECLKLREQRKKREMMTQSEKVKIVAAILKKRFNNLTVSELVNLSFSIVETLEEAETKVELPNDRT